MVRMSESSFFPQARLWVLACLLWGGVGLAPAANLVAYTEEWPPYNFGEGNEVRGIATDMLRAICKEARVDCSFRLVPWARAYKTVQETPNTVLFTTARRPSRESEFLWVGPILPRTTWVFGRAELEGKLQSVKDLSAYRVGVVREEAALNDLLEAGVPQSALSVQSSNQDVLRMMASTMVDAMVETEVGMAWQLRNAGMEAHAYRKLIKLSDGGAYYYALNLQTDPKLTRKLQLAMDKLRRAGSLETIVRSYSRRSK